MELYIWANEFEDIGVLHDNTQQYAEACGVSNTVVHKGRNYWFGFWYVFGSNLMLVRLQNHTKRQYFFVVCFWFGLVWSRTKTIPKPYKKSTGFWYGFEAEPASNLNQKRKPSETEKCIEVVCSHDFKSQAGNIIRIMDPTNNNQENKGTIVSFLKNRCTKNCIDT